MRRPLADIMLGLIQDRIHLFPRVMQPALGKIFGIIHMLLGFEYRSLSARIDFVNTERSRIIPYWRFASVSSGGREKCGIER